MSRQDSAPRAVGRYVLHGELAAGGMATVHVGRLLGPVGFSRTVAIKRLHSQYERDPEFVAMLVDEARIAARIRHPNVVPTLDVVSTDGELLVVMEYVEGESLARLIRATVRAGLPAIPPRIVSSILCGALQGLHAAHEARAEDGQPLGVVHRDVSPQNILVGADGIARVLDFGIAKAIGRMQATRSGVLKGKLAYMAPEQLSQQLGAVTRATDIYAAGVVLWEALTGSRLWKGDDAAVIGLILEGKIEPPSAIEPSVPGVVDAVVLRALSSRPEERQATALELARDLARAIEPAATLDVAEWVSAVAGSALEARADLVSRVESQGSAPGAPEPASAADAETVVVTPAGAVTRPDPEAAHAETQTQLTWRRVTELTPAKAAFASAALIALLFAASILGVILLRRGQRPEGSPSPSAAAAPVTPSVLSTPAPSTSAAAPSPAASAPPESAATARAAPRAPARSSPKPGAKATESKPKIDPCNPPFFVDKDGIKTFKPGCAQ